MSLKARLIPLLPPATTDTLQCSFCGKTQDQVRTLIAGPKVYICDECIDLCDELVAEKAAQEVRQPERRPVEEQGESVAGTPLCLVCRLPRGLAEVVFVPALGPVCTICSAAIRAATEEEEEG
jgi:hypothetical protein